MAYWSIIAALDWKDEEEEGEEEEVLLIFCPWL
jgi:hypothetical protein